MTTADDLPVLNLAAYERRIQQCQDEIAGLIAAASRLDEFAKLPGSDALAWLTSRGITEAKARALIVDIIRARRAARVAHTRTDTEETR